jgi:hypothetical protein
MGQLPGLRLQDFDDLVVGHQLVFEAAEHGTEPGTGQHGC